MYGCNWNDGSKAEIGVALVSRPLRTGKDGRGISREKDDSSSPPHQVSSPEVFASTMTYVPEYVAWQLADAR